MSGPTSHLRKQLILASTAAICISWSAGALRAQWYSETLRGIEKVPAIFQSPSLSSPAPEFNTSFSSALPELYFTRVSGRTTAILVSRWNAGTFEPPRKVVFGDDSPVAGDVHIAPDGQSLYVTANGDLKRSRRVGDGWGPLEPLPAAINTSGGEFYPISTESGNLYFSRGGDIHVARHDGETWRDVSPLNDSINTDKLEADAWVSPDERFMIFVRMDAENGYGRSDLYISFRKDGEWQPARNMGRPINGPGIDGSPFVSPDGKVLFFTSGRHVTRPDEETDDLNLFVVRFRLDDWS